MRESGYYRAKIGSEWTISYYTGVEWYIKGNEMYFFDSDFEAIDENRIDPEPQVNITGTSNYIIDIKHVRGDEV